MTELTPEQKGRELFKEAQKTLITSNGFLLGLLGSAKVDDAINLYIQAGIQFKKAKAWLDAGNAYTEAALLSAKIKNKPQAAFYYVEASKCYKKCDPHKAGNAMKKSCEMYTEAGRYNLAAKMHLASAELYEKEAQDIAEAMHHYEMAAQYYNDEGCTTQASKCTLKLAQFAAHFGQYDKAISIYEEVATKRIDSSLLKYSATEYFFKAALCHLCVDFISAWNSVVKYEDMFPMFTDSRECKFIKQLIKCVDTQNLDKFEATEKAFQWLLKSDPWYQMMVLRVKDKLALVDGTAENIC